VGMSVGWLSLREVQCWCGRGGVVLGGKCGRGVREGGWRLDEGKDWDE